MLVRWKRRLIRWVIVDLLTLITRTEVDGLERIRALEGQAIVAANHLGRLDAAFSFVLVKRDDLIMIVAEKYREWPIFRWLVRQLDLLWIERFEADLGTLKEVLRRLAAGGILLIAPEGTRSDTEALLEAKPGVAYIAAKSGAPVVPAAVYGTEDRVVKAAFKSFKRPEVHVVVGEAFHIPPLPRENRDEFLQQQTVEIMARIAVLLPKKYRGVYTDHPRVAELLASGV
jgi:1-acyl-sn-glycerol-3-phosphate acyltransferase